MVELDQLFRLIDSQTETAWRDSLFDLATGLGFDAVLFGVAASKHADLESSFVRSNYPATWHDRYNANRLYNVDPTVRHCMNSALHIVWRPQIFETPKQRELYEEACSFGLRCGISFPIHASGGEVGLISFSSRDIPDEQFARQLRHHISDLSLVRDYAFQSSIKYMGERRSEPPPQLSSRELEVLKLVMAGNSSHEIARIMHRAEATINFHLAKIRLKFKVKTRQQAVIKAIALGVITSENFRR